MLGLSPVLLSLVLWVWVGWGEGAGNRKDVFGHPRRMLLVVLT